MVFVYWFYGRQISTVYITDHGLQNPTLIDRLVQREKPEVRVLLSKNGQKYYTDIVILNKTKVEYRLKLKKAINDFEIQSLKILDARVRLANNFVVVGQVLEEFDSSNTQNNKHDGQASIDKQQKGQRFSYRLKRRWHF